MLLVLLGLLIMGMVLGIVAAAWVMRAPRRTERRIKDARTSKETPARRQR